jgi:hypothetical protein
VIRRDGLGPKNRPNEKMAKLLKMQNIDQQRLAASEGGGEALGGGGGPWRGGEGEDVALRGDNERLTAGARR